MYTKFSETILPKASLLDLCFVFMPGQAFPNAFTQMVFSIRRIEI